MARLAAFLGLAFLPWALAFADEGPLEELQSLSSTSRDGVIRLNDETYTRLAKSPEATRKYSIIVFFDAAMLQGNHQLNLPEFRRQYAQLARAYLDTEAASRDTPLFFADIEYKHSERTFRSEGISSLPHLKLFSPGSDIKGVTLDLSRYAKNFGGVLGFLKDSGINTNDVKPPPPISKTQMILLGVSIIVSAPFVATYVLTRKTVLHDPRLWCFGGLVIYLFSVSGGMFNIIRNMPWYVPDREKPGKYVYFLQQGGNQFGVEGLVIGSFYTVVGLLTAFNVYILPQSKSAVVKRVVGMISIFVCYFAVRKVVDFEIWKQGYWVHGFWPSSWK